MLRCLLPFAVTHRLSTKINKGLVSSLIIFSGHLHIENCHGYIWLTDKLFRIIGLFSNPPKKLCSIFLGCTGLHFGPTDTNHAKNYRKITLGALFRIPPQNALQCTTVQCNVLKCKRLNYSLQMGQIWPIMTHDDCVWQGMTYQGSGGFQGVQGGVRGHHGRLGYSRRQNEW